jgi:hypothetical protein
MATAKPKRCARCTKQLSPSRKRLKYCYRCDVFVKRQRAERAHRTKVESHYGLEPGDYDKVYEFQDGRCPICLRATGKTKRLSVDHDHKIGLTREGFRGLLCSTCNRMLGHGRDDMDFFTRAIDYLMNPPAQLILREPPCLHLPAWAEIGGPPHCYYCQVPLEQQIGNGVYVQVPNA